MSRRRGKSATPNQGSRLELDFELFYEYHGFGLAASSKMPVSHEPTAFTSSSPIASRGAESYARGTAGLENLAIDSHSQGHSSGRPGSKREMMPIRLDVYLDSNFVSEPLRVFVNASAAKASVRIAGVIEGGIALPADARLCVQAYCIVESQYNALCWSDCGFTTITLSDIDKTASSSSVSTRIDSSAAAAEANNVSMCQSLHQYLQKSIAAHLAAPSKGAMSGQSESLDMNSAVVSTLRMNSTDSQLIKGAIAIKPRSLTLTTLHNAPKITPHSGPRSINQTLPFITDRVEASGVFCGSELSSGLYLGDGISSSARFGPHTPWNNLPENLQHIYTLMEGYLKQSLYESSLFPPVMPGAEKINCPLNPGETTVANTQLCMPLSSYSLYQVPRIHSSFWYNAALIMADRAEQSLETFEKNFQASTLDQKATLAVNLIMQYIQQYEYLSDQATNDNGRKESIEVFGDANTTLSGDCEDQASAALPFLDDFLFNQHFGDCSYALGNHSYNHVCKSEWFQRKYAASFTLKGNDTSSKHAGKHSIKQSRAGFSPGANGQSQVDVISMLKQHYLFSYRLHAKFYKAQKEAGITTSTTTAITDSHVDEGAYHADDAHRRRHRHQDATASRRSRTTQFDTGARNASGESHHHHIAGSQMLTEMQFILQQYIPLFCIEGVTTANTQNMNQIEANRVTGGHGAIKFLPRNYFSECLARFDPDHPLTKANAVSPDFITMYGEKHALDLPVLIGEGTGMLDSGGTANPHPVAQAFIYVCPALAPIKKPLYPPKGKSSFYKVVIDGVTNHFLDEYRTATFHFITDGAPGGNSSGRPERFLPSWIHPKHQTKHQLRRGVVFDDLIAKKTNIWLAPQGFSQKLAISTTDRATNLKVSQQQALNLATLTDSRKTPCEFSPEQLVVIINTMKTRVPPLNLTGTRTVQAESAGMPGTATLSPIDAKERHVILNRLQSAISQLARDHFPRGTPTVDVPVYANADHLTNDFFMGVMNYLSQTPHVIAKFSYKLEHHSQHMSVWRMIFTCKSDIAHAE